MSSDREEGEVYSDDDCKIIDISTDSVEQVPASAAAAVPPSKPLEVTLSARQSEDMDISPTASDKLPENDEHAGYVVEVDSPLDSTLQSPAVPEPVNRPETPPPPAPPPTISLKKRKRFSQRFLSQLRSFLLNGLDDFTSSSESDSETEDVYQQLRDQLDFHHREHQDALKKKAKLIKDLEACELVINHHNECIGNLLSEISMKSNDLVHHFKSKNRRNKRRAFNIQHDFETKIEDMLYQMNTMTQLLPENEPVTEIAWNEKPQNFPISLGALIGVENSAVKKRMVDKTVDTVDLPKQSATTQINSGQKRKRKTNNLLSKEEELRQKLVLKKSKNLVTTPEANENIKNATRMKIVEVSTNSPSNLVHSTSSAPVSPIKVVNPSFTTKAVRPAYSVKSKEDVTEKENSKLFEGPLMYFRSFILDPMYPIKQSLEQLRTRINPEVPMCYYELFGFCIDQTCPDQHQRDSRLSDQQLLEEIISFVPGRSKENLEKQATSLLKEKTIEKIIEDLRREVSGQSFIKLAVSRVEFV